MKLIGIVALIIGGTLLAIYAAGWIALATEVGIAEAGRRAIYLWPGNAIGVGVVVLALVFVVGGLVTLTSG